MPGFGFKAKPCAVTMVERKIGADEVLAFLVKKSPYRLLVKQ